VVVLIKEMPAPSWNPKKNTFATTEKHVDWLLHGVDVLNPLSLGIKSHPISNTPK